MRLTLAAFAVLAVAGIGAWVVESEPDFYLRTRYPLEYEYQGNVDRWQREGAGIAFSETRRYVGEVERVRRLYAQAYGRELGLR